jgi:hypothetical protein
MHFKHSRKNKTDLKYSWTNIKMSFSDLVNKAVNANVDAFIERIASTYNLKAEELRVMWSGDEAPVKSRSKPKTVAVSDSTPKPSSGGSSELNSLNKPELVAQCKARGLKTTGTKVELVARLSGEEPEDKKPKEKATKAVAPKASASKKEPAVVKSIQTKLEPVKVAKNSFGNHEHSATGLVFDKNTKKVIGKQNPNGKVDPITDEDIEVCKKYKLPYTIPENLNSKKMSVVVDEDDGDEDLGEDLGEEEELEDDVEDEEELEEVEEEVEEEFVDEE